MIHKTVLLHETIDGLDINGGDVVIDGTLGNGGHSEEILKNEKGKITLIALDLDDDALERSKNRLKKYEEKFGTWVFFLSDSFRNIDKVLKLLGFKSMDKMVLDLGLSSNQLEESGRGFTFQKNEPLQMTFTKSKRPHRGALTAYDVVNLFEEENLADVIYGYGEEKFSRRIAKAIVENRQKKEIETTFELASIIHDSVPSWYRKGKTHPATKTFQAIRIAVNDELGALSEGLEKGFELLNTNGRIAIISFHSLEDRIVKNFFRDLVKDKKAVLLNKKPITPSTKEIKENPRSRSAKLRIIIKK